MPLDGTTPRQRREMRPKMPRVCAQCGVSFFAFASYVKAGGGRFCTRQCYFASRGHLIARTCEWCGGAFSAYRAAIDIGGARFCRLACRTASRQRPLADRFWEKVNKNGPIPPHCPEIGPCWTWGGGVYPNGYGLVVITRGVTRLAHRVVWELTYGPIPDELDVCHHCDNPPCVRPDHLFLGTVSDNMEDMHAKGRWAIKQSRSGAANGHSKLTEQQALAILTRYRDGTPLRLLSAEYGVDPSTIWSIGSGKTWKHLQPMPLEPRI